jgi:hypothetical protein
MMGSEYISEDIKRLTFNLVKALFERTGGNLILCDRNYNI